MMLSSTIRIWRSCTSSEVTEPFERFEEEDATEAVGVIIREVALELDVASTMAANADGGATVRVWMKKRKT